LSFVDHVAESPVSIKALFSLLCGIPPLPDAALETSSSLARLDCASLPEVLSSAGFDAGFFHGGYFAFTDKRGFLNERGFSRLVDGEDISNAHWHNGWGTDDRVVVDEALAFLDARADQARSSFVVVVPLVPHHEYFLPPDAPQPFGNGSMLARYKNGLHFADDVLRRLVDGYKARGLYDDSVFVIVGDHGEAFDEHPRNRLHGAFLFEENLRAPLIIHSPRGLPSGAQTSLRPSTHADVRATILDLVDVTAHARPALVSIAGQSLVASDYTPRASVHFTSYPDARIAWRGARQKLLIDDDSDRRTLFDIRADPAERRALRGNTDAFAQAARATLHARRTVLQQAPRLDDTYLERVANAAHLELREVRVFNMARRCLPFRTHASDDVVLTLPALSPPATRVGFGIDDASRQQRRGALHAHITSGDTRVADLVVDSVFERSSTVATIAPATQVTITIAPSAKQASGCVWVAP
jgi:arylsulfatase A-like enzyme